MRKVHKKSFLSKNTVDGRGLRPDQIEALETIARYPDYAPAGANVEADMARDRLKVLASEPPPDPYFLPVIERKTDIFSEVRDDTPQLGRQTESGRSLMRIPTNYFDLNSSNGFRNIRVAEGIGTFGVILALGYVIYTSVQF